MKYLLALVAALVGLAASQTPIPSRPQGYVLLEARTERQVVVEAFYDHQCDDSKANWPILLQVVNSFARRDFSVVAVLVHIFPLPYHHNAYFMQQAGEVVRRDGDHDLFQQFIQFAFDNQDEFLDGAVNLTEPQVKQKIATATEAHLSNKVDANKILQGFDDSVIVQRSRYAWKYGCSRGISGTPQFLVNGVHMPDGPDYTASQWETFIDSLIATNSGTSHW